MFSRRKVISQGFHGSRCASWQVSKRKEPWIACGSGVSREAHKLSNHWLDRNPEMWLECTDCRTCIVGIGCQLRGLHRSHKHSAALVGAESAAKLTSRQITASIAIRKSAWLVQIAGPTSVSWVRASRLTPLLQALPAPSWLGQNFSQPVSACSNRPIKPPTRVPL